MPWYGVPVKSAAPTASLRVEVIWKVDIGVHLRVDGT